MEYRENKVDGFLSDFIKCFWEYQNNDENITYTILPDGCFDLIIEIKNNRFINVTVTGIWTIPVKVRICKNTKLIGIRFKLLAAEYILKQSIKNILNTKKIWKDDFYELKDFPFDNFDNFDKLTNYLSEAITCELKKRKNFDKRKLQLFKLLYENKGELKINNLVEKVSWSNRQINRYLNQQFGISLKTLSNIIKCNSTYPQITKGKLFPQLNYYDQSHFIKEIKKYTGNTPKELYKNKNDRFLQLTTLKTL